MTEEEIKIANKTARSAGGVGGIGVNREHVRFPI